MSVSGHIFIHIFISHCCFFIVDAGPVKGLVKTEVGHDRRDDRVIVESAVLFHVFSAHIQDQIAVYFCPVLIHSNTPVCVAVVCESHIQVVLFYKSLQDLYMSGTAVGVDICSVRFIVDHIDLCTQCFKYILCNAGRTSVGTVQSDLYIFK